MVKRSVIKKERLKQAWLVALLALNGCGGGGSSSTADPVPAPEPVPDVLIESINDPLIEHQWYLYNYGQSALTVSGDGGTLNSEGTYADIRVFDTLADSPTAYAQGYSGNGVRLAIIDNSLEIAHEDLAANVLENASYNFYADSNGKPLHDPTPPLTVENPDGHHGTAVSGLAAARGGNELGIWGVAPSAELMGFNLLYANFDLTMELAALGYGDVINNTDFPELYSESVDVFNMSYGRNPYQGTNENPLYSPEIIAGLKAGTQTLRDGKGAIYVKAGGNEYDGGVVFDANWCAQAIEHQVTCYNVNMENENVTPYQMVVGAFNADDQRSSYSNTGSALWLVGPGGEYGLDSPALMTTDMSGCGYGFSQDQVDYGLPLSSDFNSGVDGLGNESCHYFSAFNGSSSSAPVISGIAALLLEANPNLTWRDLKHILATTARQLDPELAENSMTIDGQSVLLEPGWVSNAAGYHYSNHYGFGAPNTLEALRMAEEWKSNGETLPAFKESDVVVGSVPADAAIPDNSTAGLTAILTFAESLSVESVELVLSIEDLVGVPEDGTANKIDMSDYQVILRSPSGTESVLLTPFNAYQSGYDMRDLKLISHAFYGESSQGDWQLVVRDVDGSTSNRINHAGEGKLTAWSLKIYGH
ncbi:S8 family serine peptidase [Thiomicrorhabdus sp. zzn3]|uniref:S8 family serine peptidase n=1 Tax=Thiomicrorhabdus sp. zzn3 TaxID=3039775 RepID=UPI0024365DA6|nr:S8 family serine peptidase [Thiomicrorhabdus sp. zzn3]MDG6777327.1 S8 family serine peptidase [Thiomicrorhabdus sp. zzn3]